MPNKKNIPSFTGKLSPRSTPLGFLFLALAIIPSIILSLIAIRAIRNENAFIHNRLRNELFLEVNQVAQSLCQFLVTLEKDLDTIMSDFTHTFSADSIHLLKPNSPFIAVPFLLSAKRDIEWPKLEKINSREEFDFIRFNRDFFQDRIPTTIFKKITSDYNDRIGTYTALTSRSNPVSQVIPQKPNKSILLEFPQDINHKTIPKHFQTLENESSDQEKQQWRIMPVGDTKPANKDEKLKALLAQKEKLNDKAKGKRKVLPPKIKSIKKSAPVYTRESLRFSQLIQKQQKGIIPRIIDDKMMLLFWKKCGDKRIIGAVINNLTLREKLVEKLPLVYSHSRILTVLDHNRTPLIDTGEKNYDAWRSPFVYKEIHEFLPHWVVAANLSNPHLITSQARLFGWLIGIIIAVLLIIMITGVFMVFRSINQEIHLAQQKATFVTNVSHELKTPLTSIRLLAEMLKEDRQPDRKKQRKYLSIMVSETERLTRLINNVLDFSHPAKKNKEYVLKQLDIVNLTQEVFAGQRIRLEQKNFTLSFSSPMKTALILGDVEALKQVLVNLLENAEKYSIKEKLIAVTVTLTTNNEDVIIDVKDHGIGVPKTESLRIFNEFYRVDDSLTARVRGTGLGLTIAQKIIEQHQGTIHHIPGKPSGSIFRIQLPLLESHNNEKKNISS